MGQKVQEGMETVFKRGNRGGGQRETRRHGELHRRNTKNELLQIVQWQNNMFQDHLDS